MSASVRRPDGRRTDASASGPARIAQAAGRALDLAGNAALGLGMLVGGGMALAITFEVVMRYFFNAPTRWVNDASAYGLLWIAFLVGPWVTRNNEHIQMELLSARLKPVAAARLRVITALIVAAVLFLLCYLTAHATINTWNRGVLTTSGSWEIPQAYVWMVMPVGSLLMALEALRLAVRSLRSAANPDTPQPAEPAVKGYSIE